MATQFKACSVNGCNRNAHGATGGRKGLCNTHRKRLARHGDPTSGGTYQGDPMRFITDVALPYQGSDCLLWPYAKIGSGYGHVKVDDKDVLVTRYVCTVVNGPPPTPDHEAAHSCGSGHLGCITKRHLSWKTPAENQADRLLHGTDNRGERHGRAKLTEDQAREILSLRGKLSQRKIAAKYGVSHSTISLIHLRRNWAWM